MDPFHEADSPEASDWLCLVSEFPARRSELADLLEPEYEVRFVGSQELLRLSAAERDDRLAGAAAVVVDWRVPWAPVVLGLRSVVHPRAVPFLTLCSWDETEHVSALELGADGVLEWPLNPRLLKARLRAYRRLASQAGGGLPSGAGIPWRTFPGVSPRAAGRAEVWRVGPLTLDHAARQVYAAGHALALTPREFHLLAFLMQRAGSCVVRDDLLDEIWGADCETETNVLDVQVYTLRRKLAPFGLRGLIQTVRGVGFRLRTPEDRGTTSYGQPGDRSGH